ncbi:MAG: hypothetical protein K2I21_11025 [Acetatifactor sp.]|nr:hypothetical protein [Acetatifactor sp.]
MSIDIYAFVSYCYFVVLFLLSILAGIVVLVQCIRGKEITKHWLVIPILILYSFGAQFNTFTAYIAYGDPAEPNYRIYQNWELHNFILKDIIFLVIWLCIGVLLYLLVNWYKKSIKTRRAVVLGLITGIILVIMVVVFLYPWFSLKAPYHCC